jgi:hypothetical protein
VFSFSGYQVFPVVIAGSPFSWLHLCVCLSLGGLTLRNRLIRFYLFVVVSTAFVLERFVYLRLVLSFVYFRSFLMLIL